MVDRWSSRCRGSMGVHLLVHLAIVFGCAMLILCPAADAAAAASATKAKAKAASRTPSLPHVPLQFRAKARLFLLEEDEPYLVLYHHDSVAQRTREDFYSKIDGRHHRVYTSIRYLDKGIAFMIYHKQAKSPRACFIVPSSGPTIDWAAFRAGRYMGEAVLVKDGANVTCHHWRTTYDSHYTEFCTDARTGFPLIAESSYFRVDVLSVEVASTSPNVFDPRRASLTPCGIIGSAPSADWWEHGADAVVPEETAAPIPLPNEF